MSRHRGQARVRWGRIGLTASAATVMVLAVLAGLGVLSPASSSKQLATDAGLHATTTKPSAPASAPATAPASPLASPPASEPVAGRSTESSPRSSTAPTSAGEAALPDGSGSGKRAVFDQSRQRVWIVGASGRVERTYPVSGSDEDNLRPGTYHVYSKSRWAVGIDDSGVMQYFVRFAHGTDNGAAIGFHTIPTKRGKPLQTVAQLGERLSHGCIRQKTADAIAMWDFAPVGTKVVVVA